MSAGSAAVAELVHEVRGAAGSVRLALTTLLEAGDDPELRRELLESADGETRRLLRRLSLITPVVACLTANGRAESVQLRPALRSARRRPRVGAGRQVTMRVSGEPVGACPQAALEQGLVALVGAVAAGEWSSIKAHADDGAVVVVLPARASIRETREFSAAMAGAVGAERGARGDRDRAAVLMSDAAPPALVVDDAELGRGRSPACSASSDTRCGTRRPWRLRSVSSIVGSACRGCRPPSRRRRRPGTGRAALGRTSPYTRRRGVRRSGPGQPGRPVVAQADRTQRPRGRARNDAGMTERRRRPIGCS